MQQLEDLAERLLREGVAYHHVRRFVGELRDHYEDARRAEMARGANAGEAEAAALTRLGTMDELARGMIARPELRALSARFPRLWGCGAPLALWLGTYIAVIFSLVLIFTAFESAGLFQGSPELAVLQKPADVFLLLLLRGLPVMVGIAMLVAALRQRTDMSWPLMGAALLAAVAGSADAGLLFSLSPDTKGELSFGFGMSSEVLMRAAAMFAAMLTPLLLKGRLTRPVA